MMMAKLPVDGRDVWGLRVVDDDDGGLLVVDDDDGG
jgi:hypothetical protein